MWFSSGQVEDGTAALINCIDCLPPWPAACDLSMSPASPLQERRELFRGASTASICFVKVLVMKERGQVERDSRSDILQ